jgi:hypothetical protein
LHHIHQLIYCSSSDHWQAYETGEYYCPIHCGDSICIRIKDRYFEARVELDSEWYVLIEEDKFHLHPKQTYDVILMF